MVSFRFKYLTVNFVKKTSPSERSAYGSFQEDLYSFTHINIFDS